MGRDTGRPVGERGAKRRSTGLLVIRRIPHGLHIPCGDLQISVTDSERSKEQVRLLQAKFGCHPSRLVGVGTNLVSELNESILES